MGFDFFFLTNLIYAIICFIMAVCFVSFPIPNEKQLHNYRISLRVLALAYIVLSILTILILVFHLKSNSDEPFSFVSLLISSSQAMLFTFTLIILLNPRYFKRATIIKLLLPLLGFSVLYLLFTLLWGDPDLSDVWVMGNSLFHPTLVLRLVFFVFYLFQIGYYASLFFKEEKSYKAKMNDYYAEVNLQLGWVRKTFLSALVIGVLSAVAFFFPFKYFDACFTILLSLFYFVFAVEYLKYTNVYELVKPIFENETKDELTVTPPVAIRLKQSWGELKNIVITDKIFLREGVNIEEVAVHLKIGRTALSNYINSEEGMNFNSWINTLRIEEAKRLMRTIPGLSFLQISEMTGYSEQANFSRQFKQLTGVSPTIWRSKLK